MSVMKALKDATWDIHMDLEKRLAVKNRFAELPSYRAHLGRLWAFFDQAEQDWAVHLNRVLPDFDARRKAPLLLQDCRALGVALQPGAPVPSAADGPSALGGFYVLEGSTLGGQYLQPIVERQLGLTSATGASYLTSYGLDVKAMWSSFGAVMEAQCQSADSLGCAVNTARLTFQSLADWLCDEPA